MSQKKTATTKSVRSRSVNEKPKVATSEAASSAKEIDDSFLVKKISTKSSGEVNEALDPLSEYIVVKVVPGASVEPIAAAEISNGIRKGVIITKTFPKPDKG